MGQARVLLTKQNNFYYVLTNFYYALAYENLEENSSLKTCFPYANGEQEKTLEKARNFGKGIAKNLGTSLEENLQNTNNNS